MKQQITIQGKKITLDFDPQSLTLSVKTAEKTWEQNNGSGAYVEFCGKSGAPARQVSFAEAENIYHEVFENGVGRGIESAYSGFALGGNEDELVLRTRIWLESAEEDVYFELLSEHERPGLVKKVVWPGPFILAGQEDDCYTVLPLRQGILIPNRYPKPVETVFEGRFYNMGYYMPWWAQIDGRSGVLAIAQTPWDGGCDLSHPAGGPTVLATAWHSSLGKMDYRRVLRLSFYKDCDYNTMCKAYRDYIYKLGYLFTLEQKAFRNPKIKKLIGSFIVTDNICIHIEPESAYYKPGQADYNDRLVTFQQMGEKLTELKKNGAQKVYFHMDGWGNKGYDNLHPDILPPCEAAGGWHGMGQLSSVCHNLDYLLALHDEYIQYYKKAPTYRDDQVICDTEGNIISDCIWFGGEQGFLCTQYALHYLQRNYTSIEEHGISVDGTYLDGFTAAPVLECAHPNHRMSRRECLELRRQCFARQTARGYLVSSEEAADAILYALDLVHHAPYARGQGEEPLDTGAETKGIPVPLHSLVYHDCIVVPWSPGKGAAGIPLEEDGFLHGMLNGGLPYLPLDASQDTIERLRPMCKLHERVAFCEMIRHERLDKAGRRQRSTFSDGTTVEVDFDTDCYAVFPPLCDE